MRDQSFGRSAKMCSTAASVGIDGLTARGGMVTSETDNPADGTIGEDLKAAQIEFYALNDRPDLLPDEVSYYGSYRLATPRRVLFFKAAHKIDEGQGNEIDVHISAHPFQKDGEGRYGNERSDQFSPAELDHVRKLIISYLKTDRTALHPIYRRGKQVKSISVRI